MIIENKRIIECTNNELFEYYLTREFDDIMSYSDFKNRCVENGTIVIE